jgi:surface polysaccharide O-acyltransferase-like enzyme
MTRIPPTSSHNAVPQRIYWIDYLRAINILGTVVFHSFLAYSPFVQKLSFSLLIAFPFVDRHAPLPISDLILLVRPIFSMQLMFFISGLFAWRGLVKRGPLLYLKLRAQRLLVPLVFVTVSLMPLTYLPSHLIGENPSPGLHLAQLWFLWVLFSFDMLFVIAFYFFRNQIEFLIRSLNNIQVYFLLILGVLIGYLPLANVAGDSGWVPLVGPFILPISRLGLYIVYFFAGIIMGSRCLASSVQATNYFSPFSAPLLRVKTITLIALAPLTFFIISRLSVNYLINAFGVFYAWILVNASYAISGLALVAALLLFSKKYLSTQRALLDNLSSNSYCIYLIHYLVVVWIQYILYYSPVAILLKPVIVVMVSIVFSWLLADLIRRVPLFKPYLLA